MSRRDKSLPQCMEALRASASESDLSDFHELRQDFSPHRHIAEQRAIVQRLDALAKETRRLEEVYRSKVEAVEELCRSVLGKAFGGEL